MKNKFCVINNEKGYLNSLIISVLAAVIVAIVSIVFPNSSGSLRDLFQSSSGGIYEVAKSPKDLNISTEPYESLNISEIAGLRNMLEEKRFEELNGVLKEYQEAFETDQADECKLYDAYGAFSLSPSFYEDLFKEWIDATPDQYQPYLAIAHYYYGKGWESRGFKWRKETSDEQIEEMMSFFAEAEDHIRLALEIKPDLVFAYNILIGICNATGSDAAENEMIQKASELFPYSFLIKFTSLWAKEPRWGGSYPLMEEIAKEAEQYSDKNPKLSMLYGLIYYDQARRHAHNEKPEKALELLNKTLMYGEYWVFYSERAKTLYYYLEKYDEALDDINRSIELRPAIRENYVTRSRIYFAKKEYADSIDDLSSAEELSPGNAETQKWREWAGKNMMNRGHRIFKTDIRGAADFYDLSIEFDDENFETYYWRGRAYTSLKEYEAALLDFEACVELNPRHFKSYRMIDYLLARDRQWDNIIYYWDRFLELEPDHADAYYERSGTHYHNGDLESAMEDLNSACELGHKSACKRYNKMR